MSGLTAVLIGGRRARQGLGPFIAGHLAAARMEVVGVSATSTATAEMARKEIAATAGLDPRPYVDIERMIAVEKPALIAILSPTDTHEEMLKLALTSRHHVLCEKPLLSPTSDSGKRVAKLMRQFSRAGLMVVENCQWPDILPAFHALYPDAAVPPKRFEMELSPIRLGLTGLSDCLPHVLSLLQALAPDNEPSVSDIWITHEGQTMVVGFAYRAEDRRIEAVVRMRKTASQPRAAALVLDGQRADRRLDMRDYSMRLEGAGRSVLTVDPMACHLRRTATRLQAVLDGAPLPDSKPIVARANCLSTLVAAAQSASK